MNKTEKHPGQTPILFLYTRPAERNPYGRNEASGYVYLEFKYQDDDELKSYYYIDYNEIKADYYQLECRYLINGGIKQEYSDEFNGFLFDLRYESTGDLRQDRLLGMFKTLQRINKKLEAITSKEGMVNSFSEYVRRVATVVKAKEIAIAHSRYSIKDGLPKIDALAREVRRQCLEITGNSDESFGDRVQTWCDENGYSEPQQVDGHWWAFPPNGVMQICIDSILNI